MTDTTEVAPTETAPTFDETLSTEIDRLFDAADQTERRQGQERGEGGRFAARAAEGGTPTGQQQQTTQEITEQIPEAPASCSEFVKANWATLQPEVRQALIDREAEVEKVLADGGERLKGYESLERIVGPRRAALQQSFGSAEAAMEQLFALSDFAGKDFPGFVHWMCQQRGVDPKSLFEQIGQHRPVDPTVATLQQTVGQLQFRLSEREQAEVQAQDREAAATIDGFRTQKSDKGELLHPHWDTVKAQVGVVIKSAIATGQPIDLEQAYKIAVAADGKLQERIVADKATADLAAADEAAKRKAASARHTQRSDLRSSTGSPNRTQATLDDSINEALDRLGVT